MAAAVAYPASWTSPLPAPPAGDVEEEEFEKEIGDEALAALTAFRWLFPPGASSSSSGAPGASPSPGAASPSGGAGGAAPGAGAFGGAGGGGVGEPAPALETHFDFRGEYTFAYLQTEQAHQVVHILLAPHISARRPGATAATESLAQLLGRALELFTVRAYEVLSASVQGRAVLEESDRQNMIAEACLAMKAMVQRGLIDVQRDLVFALEAFGASKGRSAAEQPWLTECLQRLLKGTVEAAPEEHGTQWRRALAERIRNEPETYSLVDVRAWPMILSLVGATSEALDREAFKSQVTLQLCIGGDRAALMKGLGAAAAILSEVRLQEAFSPEEIRETFNDRKFERRERKELMIRVLRGAPHRFTQEVLRGMDDADVDVGERDDEEMYLVRDLLKSLRADIRCCPHASYRMKADWLATRWDGVVVHGELSPEQVCDHIEAESNFEEHLRTAVNRCLKSNRKFEAARMLARTFHLETRVFETNRNDKQLEYLVSLYKELEPPPDRFAPCEESTLVLPLSEAQVLLVQEDGDALQRLEAELLGDERPRSIGVWWFWRCLDPSLDFWPRAASAVVAWSGGAAILDFLSLETVNDQGHSERRGKGVLRRILEAPHLLKVVHQLDQHALGVLQRAVVPQDELYDDDPNWPHISPALDAAVVTAYIRRTRPTDPQSSKLTGMAFGYLRLELCLSEALGNFERRPMRKRQQHYMLSLAWCPWMILRTVCSFGLLSPQAARQLIFRAGRREWGSCDQLAKLSFLDRDAAAAAGGEETFAGIEGPYAENLWVDESEEAVKWRDALMRPSPNFDLPRALATASSLLLPPEAAPPPSAAAVESLFDRDSTSADLAAMFEAFNQAQRGGGQ